MCLKRLIYAEDLFITKGGGICGHTVLEQLRSCNVSISYSGGCASAARMTVHACVRWLMRLCKTYT